MNGKRVNGRRGGSRHRTPPRLRLRPAAVVWLAAVCLGASLVIIGYANGGGPRPVSLAAVTGVVVAPGPGPSGGGEAASVGTASGEPVATTPAVLLELLSRLLPSGEITGAYEINTAGVGVSFRFTRGGRHTYVTFSVWQRDVSTSVPRPGCTDAVQAPRCTVMANGSVMRLFGDFNCGSPLRLTMSRSDNLVVLMDANPCGSLRFPPYSGNSDPEDLSKGGVLTPVEMELVAADDQWSMAMRPELAEAGNRHFPGVRKATDAEVLTQR